MKTGIMIKYWTFYMEVAPFTKQTNFCTNIVISKKLGSSITFTPAKEWQSLTIKILLWDFITIRRH